MTAPGPGTPSASRLDRVAARPWRTALTLLLLLGAVAVAMQCIGLTVRSWPRRPPPLEAIPYHSHLGDGILLSDLGLPIAPASVPPYDPGAVPQELLTIAPWPLGPGAEKTHLCAFMRTGEGGLGWPVEWIEWTSGTWWDLTDPGSIAPHADAFRSTWFLTDASGAPRGSAAPVQLVAVVARGDGADAVTVRTTVGPLLVGVGAVVAAALGATLLIVVPRRRRSRRRTARGQCVLCGHLLGPAPRPHRCPECGASTPHASG